MRATLAMFVFVMGLFILTTADDIRNFQRFLTLRPRTVFLKHRTKLKDLCAGYKPRQIATAIGFGKRFVSGEELNPDKAPYMILQRLQGILPENHSFIQRLRRQMKINAEEERTKLGEERKSQNEGNEEQLIMMDLP